MAGLPVNVSTCTVTGRLAATMQVAESDPEPDVVPLVGKVIFTPSVPTVIHEASNTIFVPNKIEVTLDDSGNFSVILVASDDPDLNPTNWTYTVSFALASGSIAPFSFFALGGQTIEITDITPVMSSAGSPIVRGETGPPGPPNVLTVGDVTTGPPGSDAEFTIEGTSPHQTISVVIPRGDPGGGGAVDSVNGETGVVVLDAADVGAATAAQGAKADTAVQPGTVADFALLVDVDTTGTTDAAPTINAAVTSLSALGGGTVTLPKGSIRLDTPIIPKDGVRVRGLGPGTVLYPRQEGFTYTTGSTSTPLSNFHISDLIIDGTHRTGTFKGYHGQFHVGCSWTNLIIRNTGMTGLGPDKLRQCLISNVTTEDTGLDNDGTQPSGNGIGVGAGGWLDHESFSIVNCNAIRAKRYGIMVEGSDSVSGAKIIGNFATGCGSAGFGLGCGYGVIAQGNIAYANTGNGIELSNLTLASAPATGYAIVSGNWVYKNVGHGISYRVDVHRANNGGVQIVDNAIRLNTGNGIDVAIDLSMPNSLEQVAGFKIDRNVIAVNTGTGINLSFTGTSGSGYLPTGWTIDENTFYRDNIRLAGNMKGSSISRNVFALSAVAEDGIYLGYGGAATTLTSCMVIGNLYTGDNATKVAVNIDPAVTLTKTRVFNNLPDSAADITNIAASYTAKLSDRTIVSNGATTIYVPQPATALAGAELTVKNINAANVTLAFTPSGPTIDGATTLVLPQWGTADLVCTGTQWLKK